MTIWNGVVVVPSNAAYEHFKRDEPVRNDSPVLAVSDGKEKAADADPADDANADDSNDTM